MALSKETKKRSVLRSEVHAVLAVVPHNKVAATVRYRSKVKQKKVRGPRWPSVFILRWSKHSGVVNEQRNYLRNQNAHLSVPVPRQS